MRLNSQRIAGFLIARRIPLLLVGIIAVAAAFLPAGQLTFDRSIETMFASDDPLLPPYQKLKRTFGGNEVVMAVYVDDDLFDPDGKGIERLADVAEQLGAVPGVNDVVSLHQPVGDRIVEENYRVALALKRLLEGYTHSRDGRIAAVVCMLLPRDETNVPRGETIDQLRAVVQRLPSGMIAGEPVMIEDGFRYVEEDGRRMGWASTLLLSLTILFCFRSLRWVIVPIVVVQWTRITTQAVLVGSGLQLSMVSSMLTAIVTVVGMATVVHIIVRFRDARLAGLAPPEALTQAGGLLAGPIFWACSTTAVGFASLTFAEVGPVQDFGLMMAAGAMLVLVGVTLSVPGLALLGSFDTDPKRAWGEGLLDRQLDRIARAVQRRPKTIGLVAFALSAIAAAGVHRLEIETDFTRNFRADSPIVRSYEFVETNLGGAGVWDVIVPAPESLNWEYLRRVRVLEQRLRREVILPGPDGRPIRGLTKVISLADVAIARSPRNIDSFRLSTLRNLWFRKGMEMMSEEMPVFMDALYGEDPSQPGQHYLRIMLRARERQPSAHKRALIEQVTRIGREEFPPTDDTPGAEVTGFFVLLTNLIDSVIRDQWLTFGVATLGIGLMLAVALRSPVLALVALIPNALPIIVVTGLLGWVGLKINMGAAMIAAVSMGLSIDSSIHYITAFRRARAGGKSLDEALLEVHGSVGRAMTFSTLALIVGFTVLATSQFVPTIYFGALVSLAMLGGLAGNLVVLPLLLSIVEAGRVTARPANCRQSR